MSSLLFHGKNFSFLQENFCIFTINVLNFFMHNNFFPPLYHNEKKLKNANGSKNHERYETKMKKIFFIIVEQWKQNFPFIRYTTRLHSQNWMYLYIKIHEKPFFIGY